jgi:hypothetical protein
MRRLFVFQVAVLLPGLALGACTYDLDKIYENDSDNAGADGGSDAGAEPLPDPLIELWNGQSFVDEACVRCATSECKAENVDCRGDAECASLTRCAAEQTDPGALDNCRSQHVAWLSENPSARTLGGPYYACVFRDQCAEQCATHTNVACLRSFNWTETPKTSVPVTFQFANALESTQFAGGLMVKACRGDDVNCVSTGAAQTTDATGKVMLDLPTPLRSFTGYLDLSGGDWYPTLLQLGYPLARPATVYIPIVDRHSIELNIIASGVEPDPTRGQVQMRMFGCAGVGLRGVSFTASANFVDGDTRTWYATPYADFEGTATGDLGSGGIINVKPGFVDITAKLADDTVVARTRVPVRASYLTIVVLAPLASSQ